MGVGPGQLDAVRARRWPAAQRMDAATECRQSLRIPPRLAQLERHRQLSDQGKEPGDQDGARSGETMNEEEIIESIAIYGAETHGQRWREMTQQEKEYWLDLARRARKSSTL